jgi:polyisoprenoid-binding protein YceI
MSTQIPIQAPVPTAPRRPHVTAPTPTRRGRHVLRWIALTIAIPTLVGGFGLWWLVLRHHAPAAVSLGRATAGVSGQGATSDVSGTWKVDRTITNADGTATFAGFRVNENLVGVGATTVVGRSPAVDGTVTVDGTTITAAQFTVDLTAITSNDSRRDPRIQDALDTSRYPTATFVLTDPIDVGSVPAQGQQISVAATGDLTIHGVTRHVTVDLQAQLENNVLVVVGSAPVTFSDFGVKAPSAPIVASVDDHGTIELQLYLTK